MTEIERIPCGLVNCYLLRGERGCVLVDTAMKPYRGRVLRACHGKNVGLIVLTHGHIDHAQNAALFSKELGAPVAMHEADVPLLQNDASQPLQAHTPTGRLLRKVLLRGTSEPFPFLSLNEGDSLAGYGVDAKVVALPGHTNGSLGILAGDSLIAGDALFHLGRLQPAVLYVDRQAMEASAARSKTLGAKRVYPGHGRPAGIECCHGPAHKLNQGEL